MKSPYSFNPAQYDDDGTLRVGALLWLTLVFLNRHLLFLALAGVSAFVGSRRGLGSDALSMFYSSPRFLLGSLPALPILIAAIRRGPKAGALPRWFWRHGKPWLLAAAILDLLLLITSLVSGHRALNEWIGLWGISDLYIIAWLLRSQRLPAVFADFPESSSKPSPRSSNGQG